ncbi:hypothetical protein NKG94_04570 [Micromonospora sp. M12]
MSTNVVPALSRSTAVAVVAASALIDGTGADTGSGFLSAPC